MSSTVTSTTTSHTPLTEDEQKFIKDLMPTCDFKGVKFKDISPLLFNHKAMKLVCDSIAATYKSKNIQAVAGLEARGFLFGPMIAQSLGVGFVALRKPGKLPGVVLKETYAKEYGTDTIELQDGLLARGARVLVVDDLLATGGTLVAAINLLKKAGAETVACALVVDLTFLDGKKKITEATGVTDILALVSF